MAKSVAGKNVVAHFSGFFVTPFFLLNHFFFFKHSFVGGFSEAGTLPRLTFSFGDVVVNDFFCEKVSLNVTALPFLFPRRGGESEHVEDAPVRGHGRRHGQSF